MESVQALVSDRTRVRHLRIHGDDLTRCARDLMLSEHPMKAYRLLTDGLGGGDSVDVEEAARGVLDGKKKLVGVNDLELVDDVDASEYLEQIRYIFAGRVRVDSRWWRPLSRVTSFGPEDMRGGNIPNCTPQFAPSPRQIRKARVEYYAEATNRVFEVVLDPLAHSTVCSEPNCGKCSLRGLECPIFEPVAAPPAWWPVCADPADALHDFIASGRELEEDGYHLRFHSSSARSHMARDEEILLTSRKIFDRHAEARADRARDAALVARCAEIRERVLAQAAGDTFVLTLNEGPALVVPRAPFVCWALGRTSLYKLAPKWETVSESGLKMDADNPYHTDWAVGAGMDLRSAYDAAVMNAAYDEAFKIQQELGRFSCVVLVDAGSVTGKTGEDIVVLPNLDPIHMEKLSKARGIITQAGGKLAHLAQIALERGVTILLVSDAIDRFPDGQDVTLIPAEGKIETHAQRH